jgi:glycosyltransferase involved in cell wall biosynthesis
VIESTGERTAPKQQARADVTIVIPCYRQAHYLEECLASVRAQTHSAWKAIVVDDCSPDEAQIRKVVERFGDPRIRIIRHDVNRGLGASRNTGIRASDTELVLPLDSDDRLAPDCLASMLPVIQADPTLDCVFPNVQKFGRSNQLTKFHGPPPGQKLVRVEDTLPGAGTMMRRRFWERVGEYDESPILRRGREDFEFYIRAFKDGCKTAHVDKPLYEYRISHTSMATACALHDDEVFGYIHGKHRAMFEALHESARFLSIGYDSAAFARHHQGQRLASLLAAIKAWRLEPSPKRAKAAARSLFSPSVYRTLRTGIVRSRIPFAGYRLHGTDRYRPFFIIGVARSGNTLFRRVLTSHSQLHIPPETFVLGSCIRKFRRYHRKLTWPDLVSLMMAEFEFHPEFHTFETWLGPLVNRLQDCARADRNLAFLIDAFYRFHAEQHGRPTMRRWGDKTPMNSLDDALVRGDRPRRLGLGVPRTLERILRVFPDAQFLHIYRDGCDVVHSHLSGGFMNNLEEAAERWLHVIRQSRNFVRRHPEQCHEVRYEDLITRPGEVVPGVCTFLGIDYEPEMIVSERSARALGDVPEWYWHKQVAAPINPKNPGKGRANFTASERETLQRIIGEELAALGYPSATEKPNG